MGIVGILDYGMGNIQSLANAVKKLDADIQIISKYDENSKYSHLLLPGVGSFGSAMKNLRSSNFDELIASHLRCNKPLLGICLGMQLMFDYSDESPGVKGLSLLNGRLRRFDSKVDNITIPQIMWNNCYNCDSNSLLQKLPNKYFYFCHSYYLPSASRGLMVANSKYCNIEFVSYFQRQNLIGCQFHPEKSGRFGQSLLREFLAL